MTSRPLRVLHTNFLHGWGGQSNRILMESIGVAARGHFVALSAPPDSKLLEKAETAGLKVHRTVHYRGGLRPRLVADVLAFRRLILDGGYDILHLHGGRDSLIAALAMPLIPEARRPRIVRTKHNIFPIVDHWGNRHQYGRLFEMHIALSQAIVDQLLSKPYVNGDRIRRIPSAIDPSRFLLGEEVRPRMREEFGIGPGEIVVAMVGRFRPEKGHDILMAAAARVVREEPRVRFLLLGAGSQQHQMAELVRHHGIGERVLMPGFRTDIPECLAAADIYAQPSRSEGLGTSVIEAGAAGLPIVASRIGGIPDIIASAEMGILVPSEDPEALAGALLTMVRNPAAAKAMGEAVRRHVLAEFSAEALTQRTEQAYMELVSLPRNGRP